VCGDSVFAENYMLRLVHQTAFPLSWFPWHQHLWGGGMEQQFRVSFNFCHCYTNCRHILSCSDQIEALFCFPHISKLPELFSPPMRPCAHFCSLGSLCSHIQVLSRAWIFLRVISLLSLLITAPNLGILQWSVSQFRQRHLRLSNSGRWFLVLSIAWFISTQPI
jgi:hypothetical protein